MKPEAKFDPKETHSKDAIEYETPKVIFEGEITTRAGSGPPGPNLTDPETSGVDLFDN